VTANVTEVDMSKREIEQQADVLWGLKAIAGYINRNKRQTHYLVEKKKIRVKHVTDKLISARRSELDQDLSSET
jgi:hypothetical protein